jgi:mannan endo-1,4-beta-mannosidase
MNTAKFNDKANVSTWASTDTAKVTEAGIMQGNAGSFSPKAFADRAQAVVTLKRLLVFLQFIN